MIYKIEKRRKEKDGNWSIWYGTNSSDFKSKSAVRSYFNFLFKEFQSLYRMWRASYYMGNEELTFEYRIVDSNGKEIK